MNDQPKRQFRVLHQLLSIPFVDFGKQAVVGFTDLRIKLLNPDVRSISLNCKQLSIFRVTVNGDHEADFNVLDPTVDVCQLDTKKVRTLDHFTANLDKIVKNIDADLGSGELLVKLPDNIDASGSARGLERDVVIVGIEFMLEKPISGLTFVIPSTAAQTTDGRERSWAERGAYLVSGSHAKSSRLWFPCVESYSENCPWDFEITVEKDMTVVAPGVFERAVPTPDRKSKTLYFKLKTPVSCHHIGLAVGPFEMVTDPKRNEVAHFCLPKLSPLMWHATSYVHQAFEYCEEHLSAEYPYPIYKQVFVDLPFDDLISYATMSIINASCLFPKSIIERNIQSRSLMALGVCQQFFGCYLSPSSWMDAWIAEGIARYLHGMYYRKYFGQSEYRYQVMQQIKEVISYEEKYHPVTLSPQTSTGSPSATDLHFNPTNPSFCSQAYNHIASVKAHLVLRMLDERIGAQMLTQVFNKMLSLASNAATSMEEDSWSALLLRTEDFVKAITALTTKEIQPFMEKWVYSGGHLRLKGRYAFNRKRNAIDFEFTQEVGVRGGTSYSGPFPIAFQELDGATKHVVQLEPSQGKYEVIAHSKTRRHKKKRIPLWTGEEIEIDLNECIDDASVLWVKFDPEFTVIRYLSFEQPDYQLHYIVKHEKDVITQLAAIESLESHPTQNTLNSLKLLVENERVFYRLRLAAAAAWVRIASQLAATNSPWQGPPPLYAMYKRMFFVKLPSNAPGAIPIPSNIIKRNNFNDFVRYFLQKEFVILMAKLRNQSNVCPGEIVALLLDVWKYNENRLNFYSDSYYRAALIEAMGECFTESVGTLSISDDPRIQFDHLTAPFKQLLENIFRALNQEKFVPSYQFVVTVSCLRAFNKMKLCGVLPVDWCVKIFKDYTNPKLYRNVRIAAFELLVKHLQSSTKAADAPQLFDFLLTASELDNDAFVQHSILRQLIENPPFTKEKARPEDCPLSTEALVERLWTRMNGPSAFDSRIRCDLVDLFYTLYGRRRPASIPIPDQGMVINLKERKAMISDAAMASEKESVRTPPTGIGSPALSQVKSPIGIDGRIKQEPDDSPPSKKRPVEEDTEQRESKRDGGDQGEDGDRHHHKKKKKKHKHKHHKHKHHKEDRRSRSRERTGVV